MIQSVVHKFMIPNRYVFFFFKSLKSNDSTSMLQWNRTQNSRNALKGMQITFIEGEGEQIQSQWTAYNQCSLEGLLDKKNHRLIWKAHDSCWCELLSSFSHAQGKQHTAQCSFPWRCPLWTGGAAAAFRDLKLLFVHGPDYLSAGMQNNCCKLSLSYRVPCWYFVTQ